ncbi:MAG: beta-galactosidase [Phycisphaeraceae bacterium]|nr:MAG: beta-galactosidase [Phycisphaeraceae bacterium]
MHMQFQVHRSVALSVLFTGVTIAFASPPVHPPIETRWAEEVSADQPWPEYPRPQMVRKDWVNLNGRWAYAITPRGGDRPEKWDGEIVVPFCAESMLSGVGREVGPDNELWYRRTFDRPETPVGGRVLLHFGAVDWRATVSVNGHEVGSHEGGYDAFTFDIADALVPGQNELVVRVWDPTDTGTQPRGKQVRDPHGIWYTAVTGIWQTVWLEPVPAASIASLTITPLFDANAIRVDVETRGNADDLDAVLIAKLGGAAYRVSAGTRRTIYLHPEDPIPAWTPDHPTLHEFTISLADRSGDNIDQVASYFGFRSIEIRPDKEGVNRLCLNGEPLFEFGPLDQGWWPDGLYTAPTDDALRSDIEATKRLGFNMIRKHVKVEPARWYTWCDQLGIMVWQDMPSGDRYIHGDMPDITRTAQSGETYERELRAIIGEHASNPCIVVWVPYNEGWGQWDTARIAGMVKQLDPTRLVDAASGWTDRGVGDLHDVHVYPGPGMAPVESDRASVLGEFGGLGLPMPGHLWQENDNWGYRAYDSQDALTDAYVELLEQTHRLIGSGLAAAVYTQTTDVEGEVNGLMTYDREVIKPDPERVRAAALKLYTPPPVVEAIVPTSENANVLWRYATTDPGPGWEKPGFDDSAWEIGRGGFGTKGTPGASIGTTWNGNEIWVRRTFALGEVPAHVELLIHHDEDAEVYLNGVEAAALKGYVTSYFTTPIAKEAAGALHEGANLMAIHCRNTGGGQSIDAGLVSVEEGRR